MPRRALVLSIVLAGMALAACGEPPITAEEEALAGVEARWKCEVGRRSFPDLEAITAARDEFLAGAGVAAAEYHLFIDQLPDRPRLRSHISRHYDEVCGDWPSEAQAGDRSRRRADPRPPAAGLGSARRRPRPGHPRPGRRHRRRDPVDRPQLAREGGGHRREGHGRGHRQRTGSGGGVPGQHRRLLEPHERRRPRRRRDRLHRPPADRPLLGDQAVQPQGDHPLPPGRQGAVPERDREGAGGGPHRSRPRDRVGLDRIGARRVEHLGGGGAGRVRSHPHRPEGDRHRPGRAGRGLPGGGRLHVAAPRRPAGERGDRRGPVPPRLLRRPPGQLRPGGHASFAKGWAGGSQAAKLTLEVTAA